MGRESLEPRSNSCVRMLPHAAACWFTYVKNECMRLYVCLRVILYLQHDRILDIVLHTYICIHMHVSACVCYIYMSYAVCVYIYMCVCYLFIYLFIYLCMYVCMYLFIYLFMCVRVGKNLCIQDHTISYKYLSPVQCMEETYPCNSRYTPIFRTIQIPYFDYFAYVLNVVKKKRVVSKANQLGIGNYSTNKTILNHVKPRFMALFKQLWILAVKEGVTTFSLRYRRSRDSCSFRQPQGEKKHAAVHPPGKKTCNGFSCCYVKHVKPRHQQRLSTNGSGKWEMISILGRIQSFHKPIEIYWNTLKYIEIYWNLLKYIEIYWNLLWPIMTYYDLL